ncbi:hypothetical protein NA56DRAFT_698312 [Hyaloscypha hepaticicola]|uniref:Uncharacterized protein n=1 Tax=Hyaloscypha hepaticicola TaxID=2082293 RepID=A0A2J6QIP7_9HELO|nr:hypothetical protein NA56DRAFT_698312 [Hyaloscypha hepaticicola]
MSPEIQQKPVDQFYPDTSTPKRSTRELDIALLNTLDLKNTLSISDFRSGSQIPNFNYRLQEHKRATFECLSQVGPALTIGVGYVYSLFQKIFCGGYPGTPPQEPRNIVFIDRGVDSDITNLQRSPRGHDPPKTFPMSVLLTPSFYVEISLRKPE